MQTASRGCDRAGTVERLSVIKVTAHRAEHNDCTVLMGQHRSMPLSVARRLTAASSFHRSAARCAAVHRDCTVVRSNPRSVAHVPHRFPSSTTRASHRGHAACAVSAWLSSALRSNEERRERHGAHSLC